MFLDASLSAIGRATEVQLNTLRRKFGVGCDPCFDYSTQQLETTTEREKEDREGQGVSLGEQFLDLLRQVNSEAEETRPRVLNEDVPHIPESVLRKRHEQKRPSSAFTSCSRQDLQKRDARTNQGPPVGSYSPREDCLASFGKVKHPTPKVPDFTCSSSMQNARPKSSQRNGESRRCSEDGTHESTGTDASRFHMRRQITFVDMARQIPRPDFLKTLTPNDPQALDPDGVLYGHLKCARFGRFYRQPCFEFGKLVRQEAIAAAGGTSNPGEYDVKFDIIKPTTTCHSFSNIPRPDFVESHSITSHLPDRSLARDCPSLTRFGRLVSPPVSVPRFDTPARPAKPQFRTWNDSKENSLEQSMQCGLQGQGTSRNCPEGQQWAWPTRQAPRTLGISVSHGSHSACRPRSAQQ